MEAWEGPTPDLADPGTVALYDELPLWSAPFGQVLLQQVELGSDLTVLDVGCGTGFPLLELAERLGPEARLHGVDPWGPAMERDGSAAAEAFGHVLVMTLGLPAQRVREEAGR